MRRPAMRLTERSRRLLWFLGLWAASVATAGGSAYLLRWISGLNC